MRLLRTSLQTTIIGLAAIGSFAISTQVTAQATKAEQTVLTKPQSAKTKRLDKLHDKLTKDHPNLRHISRGGLQVWLTQKKPNIVLLDTRPLSEYKISHIEGAVQIDPDSHARKLEELELSDKIVVVYCSVGRRSSGLATRLETAISEAGAQTVLNLEGGLFGWHNDARALVNADGPTDIIHPYNAFWGNRYLVQKDKTAYSLK